MSRSTLHSSSENVYLSALRGTLPMPANAKEQFVFQTLMVFFMVSSMVTFNWFLHTSDPTLSGYAQMMYEYPLMFFTGLLVRNFIANPLVGRIVPRVVPSALAGFKRTLAMTGINVAIMATIMTLFGTLFSHGPAGFTWMTYVESLPISYVMAFVVNLFAVNPLVKIIFARGIRPSLPVLYKKARGLRTRTLAFVSSDIFGRGN